MNNLKPSHFTAHPWDWIKGKSEAETVARNIMVISARLGDEWGNLDAEKYKQERLKDGGFNDLEVWIFNQIYPEINGPIGAIAFSQEWAKAAKEASK